MSIPDAVTVVVTAAPEVLTATLAKFAVSVTVPLLVVVKFEKYVPLTRIPPFDHDVDGLVDVPYTAVLVVSSDAVQPINVYPVQDGLAL